VSTATAPDFAIANTGHPYYFILRRLHSLTGIVFGGYIVVHLLINATLVQGVGESGTQTVFQAQVDKIHSLPFLPAIEWTFIYLPILYHTFYGIWIIATGQPNLDRYGYGKNWFYTLQRASAIVLVLFILFHILAMKGAFGGDVGRALTFVPVTYATQSTARHMNAAWWVWGVIYPVGILASCYHTANGFWTAAITWGLTISAKAQKRWGVACVGLFLFMTACGFTAFGSLVKMGSPHEPIPVVNDRDAGGSGVQSGGTHT
jgi:succinate dehydrogenase / fumarate reductase cytochrome b subunit